MTDIYRLIVAQYGLLLHVILSVEKLVKENFPEVEQTHDAIAKTIGLGNCKHMGMTEIFRTMAFYAGIWRGH